MPVNARFQADFESFYAAVQKADVTLRSFEENANKVGGALNRMTDGFSGRKLIQDATLMSEAVDRVGGISKLTASELERVGAQAAEAASKMRAMGIDVPPGIQKIAAEHSKLNEAQRTVLETVKEVAAAFAIGFTIEGAARFINTLAEEAKHLQLLSLETQTSVEDLQVLSAATREYGIDADTLAKAVFQLGQRLAGGDQSAASGLHLMGLSLQDIKDQHGMELFLTIESGLATLQGTLRDTAAADVYGVRVGRAMAAFASGAAEAVDEAKRLTVVTSGEANDAAAEYARNIERATINLHAMATTMLGPTAQGLNVLAEAMQQGAPKLDLFIAMFKDFTNSSLRVGAHVDNLATVLDHLNQVTEANTAKTAAATDVHKAAAVVVDAHTAALRFMAALERDAAATLTTEQLANLAHLKEIGALNAKNAEAIGVNIAQFEKYNAGLAAAKKHTEDLAKAQAEADAIALGVYEKQIANLIALEAQRAKSYGTAEQIAMLDSLDRAEQALTRSVYAQLASEKDRMKVIEDSGKQHTAVLRQKMDLENTLLALTNSAVLAEFNAQTERNALYGLDAEGHLKVASAAHTLEQALYTLHLSRVEGISQSAQEQLLIDAYTKALYNEAAATTAVTGAITAETRAMNALALAAITTFAIIGGAGAASNLRPDTQSGIHAGPAGPRPPGVNNAGTVSGERALGGPVSAGRTYLVGERGPELFKPSTSGTIVPGGGREPIVVQLVVDGRVLADVVTAQTTRSVMRNTKLRSA